MHRTRALQTAITCDYYFIIICATRCKARDAEDGTRDRSRARSGSARTIHPVASSDLDARHKVASLTAQLIQRDHRIRGLEQGVQTKLAEVRLPNGGERGVGDFMFTSVDVPVTYMGRSQSF